MYLQKCIRFVSCLGADCTSTTDLVSFPTAFSDTVISRGDDVRETTISNKGKYPSTIDTQHISSSQARSRHQPLVHNAVITVLPSSEEEISNHLHPIEGRCSQNSSYTYSVGHYDGSNTKTVHFEHSPRLFPTVKEQGEGKRHKPDDVDRAIGREESECIASRLCVDSSSCLNVSSTSMHIGDQAVSNTTLAGLQWCPLEAEVTLSGCLITIDRSENTLTCEKELERPHVPIEFSVGRNSDVLLPKQSSPSIEDVQVGCTSTTHELRWTLLEQEQLRLSGRSERVKTVDSFGQMPEATSQTKHFQKDNQLYVHGLHDSYALGRKCALRGNLSQTHVRKPTTPFSADNSSPMATDEVPGTFLSLNDISSDFSSSPISTSLVMSPMRLMRPNNPLPRPCTASIVCTDTDRDIHSTLTSMVSTTVPIVQRVFTIGSPLPIRLHGEEETDAVGIQPVCVSRLAPVGSEPPPVICHSTRSPQCIESLSETTDTSRVAHAGDRPSVTVLQPGKHVRLQSVAKLITANIASYRQPVAQFVPMDNVRYTQSPSMAHRNRFRKLAHSESLDLNETECSEHKTGSFGDQCKERGALRNEMKCKYVEVTFRRNLEGMLAPTCLSKSESKGVLIRLDRKLRSVVVRHFMHCYGKKGRCRSLSPANQSASLERPTRKWSPCISEKRSSSARESVISRHSSIRLQHTRPHGPVSGPRLVRPPRQWWQHIHSVEHCSDSRRMLAWTIDPLRLTIGALINFNYHLEILVSSTDGRLGITYANAVSLLNEMVGRSTRYVGGRVSSKGDCSPSLMSVQVHVHSPVLASFVACAEFDVSAVVGLDHLGLGVRGVAKRSATPEKRAGWDTISVYTKESNDSVEYKLLRGIFTGIKRLRVIEKELWHSSNLSPEICPVETIKYLTEQIIALPGKLKSYIREYLTSLVNKEVLTKKTAYGGTLAHCIRDSAYCLAVRCPRAVDPQCYEAFASLFSPILDEIRKSVCASGKRFTPVDDLTQSRIPNVLRYHVTFVRNLKGFAFPPLLTGSDYLQIEEICKSAILSWAEAKGLVGNWYSLADVYEEHPALCRQLMKKGLLLPAGTLESVVGGVCRHWPEGRSLYLSSGMGQASVDLVVQLNFDDHIRVVCVDWSGRQPRTAYRKAVNLTQWLDKRVPFCAHPVLGFLGPSPYTVGTGMHISAQIKLAHLGKHRLELEALCQRLNLSLRYNEEGCGSSVGNVFTAVFRGALGLPKASLASMFMNSLTYLQKADARYMMD